jgi:hypothetical protein
MTEAHLAPEVFDASERGDMRGTADGNWAIHNYEAPRLRSRDPGRGRKTHEGRQSRERPANLPVDRDPGVPVNGLPRHAVTKRRRGDTAVVVSRQGGGDPWRDENPGEDRLPSRGLTAADRSTDFRIELKPLKARTIPPSSLRVVPRPLLGAEQDATWWRGTGSG